MSLSQSKNLFNQINDDSEYSIFANEPYSDASLVNTREIVILRSNAFPIEYVTCRGIAQVQRTWTNFQTFWQENYDLKEETEKTAVSLGFAGSANTTN